MKKVICIMLAVLVLSAFSTAFAQEKTAKGRIELGGSVVFDRTSYDNGSITDITIMPRMGYFIIPKLALEPTLLMENYSVDPDGGDSYSATDMGALLNVAYHFEGQSGSKFVPFIFGGIGFVSHSGDVGAADEMTMILPDLGGGVKIFFTDNALIRAEAFYQRVSNANGVKDADASEFGLRAGVSIFVK
ncbi:MAG: outer membrane beta-barrel protein [Candidatus Zixiibacteriota bacterium]